MLARDLLSYLKMKKIDGNIDGIVVDYISQDSRDIKPNTIFVCVEGKTVDGHEFVESVSKQDISLFVASKYISNKTNGKPVVYVADTLKTMAFLSNIFYNFPSEKLYMVGITGTNGKTTTSHLIKHIFENSGIETGLVGTIHHKIGNKIIPTKNTTPDSITLQKLLHDMYEYGCESCVMEVSSHALALSRVIGCSFDCAIFTNLSHEHMELHKTMENYANTKELLFTQLGHGLKNGSLKTAILNLDDKYANSFIEHTPAEIITYSIKNENANFYATNISFEGFNTIFDLVFNGKIYKIKVKLLGNFNVYNLLASISCAYAKGISIEKSIKALQTFDGVDGRMQAVESDRNYRIIIDFAHTPDGLSNVLEVLSEIPHNNIITVMGHSGGNRDSSMRPKLGKIALENSSFVVFTADNPRNESVKKIVSELVSDSSNKNYFTVEDRKEAIKYAFNIAKENDIVLLAGKGGEAYQVIGDEYLPYDEFEVVKSILNEN